MITFDTNMGYISWECGNVTLLDINNAIKNLNNRGIVVYDYYI